MIDEQQPEQQVPQQVPTAAEKVQPELHQAGEHVFAGQTDDHFGDDLDVSPEIAVADSLNSALQHLRESSDRLTDLPLDESRVKAAENVADQAAQLDEQIGSIARKDEG